MTAFEHVIQTLLGHPRVTPIVSSGHEDSGHGGLEGYRLGLVRSRDTLLSGQEG